MSDSKQSFRWGILGAGYISKKLVISSWSVGNCTVVAAASNTPERVESFIKEWDISKAYTRYEDLINDPEIDVVYVGNIHPLHHDSVIMALEAGKPVLCEKPLAVNARQAREMVDCARRNKVFLMEAMWTRFLPAIGQVRKWLAGGEIGEIKQVHASFGVDLQHVQRLTDPALAGGALLDLGIYPLSFASMVMGGEKPARMDSKVELLDTGVDGSSMLHFEYENGTWAELKCSCMYSLPNDAWIIGTKGRIRIPADFYATQKVFLINDKGEHPETFPSERQQSFKYQIKEVQDCLESGKLESPIMPLDETIALAETMDQLRENWGVKYPGE